MSRSFLNSEMYRYKMRLTNDADILNVRVLVGRLFSPLVSQLKFLLRSGSYSSMRLKEQLLCTINRLDDVGVPKRSTQATTNLFIT